MIGAARRQPSHVLPVLRFACRRTAGVGSFLRVDHVTIPLDLAVRQHLLQFVNPVNRDLGLLQVEQGEVRTTFDMLLACVAHRAPLKEEVRQVLTVLESSQTVIAHIGVL